MAGQVVPLNRVKLIEGRAIDARRLPVDKWPPKTLRACRPQGRMAGREVDVTAGLQAIKIQHRVRHAAKLRFFRRFKLIQDLKPTEPAAPPAAMPRARFRKFVC
jgi:hypothetical protein